MWSIYVKGMYVELLRLRCCWVSAVQAEGVYGALVFWLKKEADWIEVEQIRKERERLQRFADYVRRRVGRSGPSGHLAS